MKNLKERGITLIALVITIIVLLILAGVTISIAMKTGIMDKAETAVDMYSEQEALEILKIGLIEYKTGRITKEEKRDLLKFLQEEFDEDASETEDHKYYEVVVNGWLFWVEKDTYNVQTLGRATATKIKRLTVTTPDTITGSTVDITITALTRNMEKDDKIVISYKIAGGSYGNVQEYTARDSVNRVITVNVGTTIDVKVEIIAKDGTTVKDRKEKLGIIAGVLIDRITMSKEETLTLGGNALTYTPITEVTLTPSITPPNATIQTFAWTSSGDSVTVEPALDKKSVKITAVKAGVTTVTATAEDGSGESETCTITVLQKLSSVTIPTTAEVDKGETVTVTATVSAGASDDKVTWEIENNATEVTLSPSEDTKTVTVTGNTVGTAKIRAIAQDGGGAISGWCTVTVKPRLKVGDYIYYDVPYTDVITTNAFTANDGWRYFGKDETTSNILLISTGCPLNFYYEYNTYKSWMPSTIDGKSYDIPSRSSYGFINNFESITFKNGTNSTKMEGYYIKVKGQESGNLNVANFKTGITGVTAAKVRGCSRDDLDRYVDDPLSSDTWTTDTYDKYNGLIDLSRLTNFGYSNDMKITVLYCKRSTNYTSGNGSQCWWGLVTRI